MEILISVIQFLLALSILIIFHEFGHYFFAKLFKTRVEKFYLFFDFLFPFSNVLPFALFKKKKGDTEFGIGWFPLGGYVKIAGMVDESMDRDQLAKPPQPWEFRSKKAWQRLLIMLGGVIVNVLLAFVIYAMVLFVWGKQKLPMSSLQNGVLVTDSFAYELGFKDGDKILAADGKPIHYFDDLMVQVIMAKEVTVERNGQALNLHFPNDLLGQLSSVKKVNSFFAFPIPAIVDSVLPNSNAKNAGILPRDQIIAINNQAVYSNADTRKLIQAAKGQEIDLKVLRNAIEVPLKVKVSDTGSIGFLFDGPKNLEDLGRFGYQLEKYEYSFLGSFPAGVAMTGEKLSMYLQQFKKIINPSTGAYKGIGGVASMTKLYTPEWDWHHFWSMTAFISIMLAFMNLLPIPGLDGGYVLFSLYEIFTGRKPNEKFLEIATSVGLIFLLLLMLYANGMDVVRMFR